MSDGSRIIVDIWTGPDSQTHTARYVMEAGITVHNVAMAELRAGHLVNLRSEPNWREYREFDKRATGRRC